MKKVNKVSINGISFTVEEEAYTILYNYLETLKTHYSNNPNGSEIMDGIETRISELFLDKAGEDKVISEAIVNEVLAIIGKPEEIYGECEAKADEDTQIKKKLYRNPDDKRIAGVLGGLASYFGIDSIWFRLVFVALTIWAAFSNWDFFNPSWFLLAYAILWICMPLAKTNRQRCEMNGRALSYDGIEKEIEQQADNGYACTGKGHDATMAIGKVFIILAGAFLGFLGIIGILCFLGVVLGIAIAGLALPDLLSSLLIATGTTSHGVIVLFKILLGIIIALPCIALIYAGIRLIFNIKSPKWKPGLIMLCVWILSLIGICGLSINSSRNFLGTGTAVSVESVDNSVDTLYVKLVDIEKWQEKPSIAKGTLDDYNLLFLDTEDHEAMKVAVYPTIELDRGNYSEACIEVESEYFKRAMAGDNTENAEKPDFCKLQGDTLYVTPVLFGGDDGIKYSECTIEIKAPRTMTVIVTGPYPHDFNSEFNQTDWFEKIFVR